MACYEYRCRTCGEVFERRRSMGEADAPTACSDGHGDVVRLLSVFATVGAGAGTRPVRVGAGSPATAGPCGAACGCHH